MRIKKYLILSSLILSSCGLINNKVNDKSSDVNPISESDINLEALQNNDTLNVDSKSCIIVFIQQGETLPDDIPGDSKLFDIIAIDSNYSVINIDNRYYISADDNINLPSILAYREAKEPVIVHNSYINELEVLYFADNNFQYAIYNGACYQNCFGKACYNGDMSKIKELIDDGTDIESDAMQDLNFVYSALVCAIKGEKVDAVEYLITKGANVNRLHTEFFATPLSYAAGVEDKEKRMEIARLLIEAGANPDGAEKSSFEYTDYPLIAAIDRGDVDFFKLLIENGASVIIKDEPENYVDIAIDTLEEYNPLAAEQIRSIINNINLGDK